MPRNASRRIATGCRGSAAAGVQTRAAGTSALIREYLWAGDQLVAVFEAGQLYIVRSDHIGRPVFATSSAGAVVWEASYDPFGGVVASSGPNINLRFPGQWFQTEPSLHQNWMRGDIPPTGIDNMLWIIAQPRRDTAPPR